MSTRLVNITLRVAYDGSRLYGWQKTPDGPTVEDELKKVLEQILRHKVELNAASRTDRGVHALGQVVSFQAQKVPSLVSLNRLLPDDIAVLEVAEVADDFHATLSAKSKLYRYDLASTPYQIPQRRLYEWHYPAKLSLPLMRKAAKKLVGKKDFRAMTNKKPSEPYADTVRRVTSIEIVETAPQNYQIFISGENFLYKMIRNLVGLIVWVGAGKIDPAEIPAILKSKDRKKGPLSAPAHGLTLIELLY